MFLCWPLQRPLFYNIVEKCTIHINGRPVGVTSYLTTTNKIPEIAPLDEHSKQILQTKIIGRCIDE